MTPGMTSGLSSLLWFILIVAMIPVALWLLKRSPLGARYGGGAAPGSMRNVATLALSASQRIVTVEVGQGESRCWLVLGVTPQHITTLHTMAPQADVPAPAAMPVPAFAQMLAKLGKNTGAERNPTSSPGGKDARDH